MNNTCFACGTVKNKKALGLDVNTLKTYCLNPNNCDQSERPEVTLCPYENDTISSALKAEYPGEKGETLSKLATKAAGVRLHPYLAMHVVKTAEENDLHSVNEALLFILNRDYEENGETEEVIETTSYVAMQPEEKHPGELIDGNVYYFNENPDTPPVVVPQSERDPITNPEPEEESVKEEEEEDEFTF